MSGEVYPAFIEGELKTERERRVNLDGRGAAVVTQSGGLITLMAGVAAFVGNTAPDKLPPLGVMALILALLFFVGAAACGILVTYPPMYPSFPVANEATMKMMRDEKREQPDDEARSVVSHVHIGTLALLRKGNDRKVHLVSAAHIAQMLALMSMSITVFVVIVRT